MKPDMKVVPVKPTQPIELTEPSSSTQSIQLPENLKSNQSVQPVILPDDKSSQLGSIQPHHMNKSPQIKKGTTVPVNTPKRIARNMKKKLSSILNQMKEEDDEYEGEEDDDETPPRRRSRIVETMYPCHIEENTR